MSTSPENEFDLEKLFLPAWAQEPPSAKHYAQYEGGEQRPERKPGRHGPRPPRREGGPGERPRENRSRDGRPGDDRRGPRREGGGKPFNRDQRPAFRREDTRERREPPPAPPEINLTLVPDAKGVESLARQIKMTGRAYPLFDIARLILQKPERYAVNFSVKKKPDGQVAQPLFVCALDDTLWLSEDEAVAHVLRNHFATFYQADRTATEPPKGKYTFVAQCGMSGAILGPPNHHDYQNQLHKLHNERFSRMPFEAFKARVKIVRDEEVVKKWVDDQSWKTEFICLNMPEPLRLENREGVEKHFREVHKDNIIKPVESHTLNGVAAQKLRSAELTRFLRFMWDEQRRFPLQIATILSQQFAEHGLQFFKVNKTLTHVSVARPHFLDVETTPLSEGIKRIVDFISAHPKSTRRKLVEALAPSPTVIPIPAAPSAPAEGAAAAAAPTANAPTEPAGPTPEQTVVIADLHWLIHQGHVI
ncbi:MAG TPA: hypothetical protein VK850_17720, partial [Candidatus Binatia bacterium]|nr:hypothetical protein [Candidatus Binatia bacterium]